jgi:hypothetical protein
MTCGSHCHHLLPLISLSFPHLFYLLTLFLTEAGLAARVGGCQARPAKIRVERRGPADAGFATVRPGPTAERSVARGRWPGAYLVRDGECGLAGADRRGDLRA